jgi:hypothetical protein
MRIRNDNIYYNILIVQQRISFTKSPSALEEAMVCINRGEDGVKGRFGEALIRHNGSKGLLLRAK